jgi:benzylsuccinate CoA-transferase BbsF subunit
MEWLANGEVPAPKGNRADRAVPYGCYRCAGDDAWCALAVETEEQWRGLLGALSDVEELRDPRFQTLGGRLGHAAELDRLVEGWTAKRPPEEAATLLQAHGVPASPVASGRSLVKDAHLQARGFLTPVAHPRAGNFLVPGNPVQMSETPGRVRRHAPLLGQDNEHVFRGLLGLPDGEIAELERLGVIG